MNYFQKIVVLLFCFGLVLGVVEPLWAVGQDVVTDDETLSAHYENTILVTDGEPEILTML